jgi:hypothetical protein
VERNYEIHDTEMLAIIGGLEEWRHYLEGARHPVEIWTDHKNLEYFRVAQKLNCRQARLVTLSILLQLTLHHKPGQSMGKPDALSRWADHRSRQGDNDNLTLLAPKLFWIHVLAGARLEGDDKSRGTVKSTEWSESDGLLMFRGKIYVPKDRELRRRIVEQHHDMHIARHAGCFKTLELVSCNYWWPQMSCYIGVYVKTCDLCNQTKVQCQ